MAKLKVELDEREWQALLMLASRGYSNIAVNIAEQLNAGAQPQPQPPGNGAQEPAEQTQQ